MVDAGRDGEDEEVMMDSVMSWTERRAYLENAWYRCLSVFSF